MRYRRDIPRGDEQLIAETVSHVIDHLRGAADPNDNFELIDADRVHVDVVDHVDGEPDLVSVIGTLDVAPNAPYLRSEFDPSKDHPEIKFIPFDEPDREHFSDSDVFEKWQEANLQ